MLLHAILGGIFVLILGLALIHNEKNIKYFCIAIALFEVVLVVLLVAGCTNATYEETLRAELVSTKADTRIEGKTAFLFTEIGEEDVYIFYYKTDDGGFKKGLINSKNVTVFETNAVKPNVVRYERSFAGYTILELETMNKRPSEFVYDSSDGSDVRYEIYVPEGTIVQEFKLE